MIPLVSCPVIFTKGNKDITDENETPHKNRISNATPRLNVDININPNKIFSNAPMIEISFERKQLKKENINTYPNSHPK
jgi:hypothetical protein